MAEERKSQRNDKSTPSARKNMHDDTQTWDDTCSCEPEPRWQALEDENHDEEDASADVEQGSK